MTTPYTNTESKKQQVETMFNNIAPTYDFLNHILSLNIDKIWRRKLRKRLQKNKPETILDVATGTGDLAFELLKLQPKKIIGIDIANEMLNIGRKKLTKLKTKDIIEFKKDDSENMSFDDEKFDAITCAFGVRNFENLSAGLTEMYRVLKTNGKVIILEFSIPQNILLKKLYFFYFNKILPFFGKIISKDKHAYTYLPNSVNNFVSGTNFLTQLQNVGFTNTQQQKLSFGIASIYFANK